MWGSASSSGQPAALPCLHRALLELLVINTALQLGEQTQSSRLLQAMFNCRVLSSVGFVLQCWCYVDPGGGWHVLNPQHGAMGRGDGAAEHCYHCGMV